jgi:hypothetical protein
MRRTGKDPHYLSVSTHGDLCVLKSNQGGGVLEESFLQLLGGPD